MNSLLIFLSLILSYENIPEINRNDNIKISASNGRHNHDLHDNKNLDYPHIWNDGFETYDGLPEPNTFGPIQPQPYDLGLSDMRRIAPIYSTGYSSPLVAESTLPGEDGVILSKNVVDGVDNGNIGIYSPGGYGMKSQHKLISLHHMIHDAKEKALRAKAESSAAELRTTQLIALNQGLKAKLKLNEAEMLQEEEQRLMAQKLSDPEILVKDTIPIANVANNSLSFEHHNELLKKKLEMINNDQNNAIKKAEDYARLHNARSKILPDSLIGSNPEQFNEFVANGPAPELNFEVPVDPTVGNFYISNNHDEDIHHKDPKLASITTGDLPYFVAHKDDDTYYTDDGIRISI